MRYQSDPDRRKAVEQLDLACHLLANDSFNRLAGRLDVTKQAISKWRTSGAVPASRACQIELLTNGEVKWQSLCPDLVKTTENLTQEWQKG
jgi:DNA-binding transcriptional regulator YdaS (Cro superfamily)